MVFAPLLRRLRPAPPKRTATLLTVPGLPAPLEFCVSPQSRRLSLRVDLARGVIRVVVPPGVPEPQAATFVFRHLDWVNRRLQAMPPKMPFRDGRSLPILGVPHLIRHDPLHRGSPRVQSETARQLIVGGGAEFLSRRVHDWLKAEARRTLAELARQKAVTIGARVQAVAVRDPRARWGSCSHQGNLSFSWRLILAPLPVFDYVVAHEVAHLRELNHSERFWQLCARLTEGDMEDAREWLRVNGAGLHRYGAE
jgi:predicted metal-dependent hydrolase